MTNTTSSFVSATTSTKFAFTYDHVNQKIVGTDINFQKAGIPGSALEKELISRMEARPAYGFTIIPTEKKPAKRSYAGLTMELMEDYLAIWDNELAEVARSKFAEMKAKKEKKEMSFAFIKSWFLDLFPKFDVKKARAEIKANRQEKAKAPYKVAKVTVRIPQNANK